jgi:hypothetical protein
MKIRIIYNLFAFDSKKLSVPKLYSVDDGMNAEEFVEWELAGETEILGETPLQ